MNLKRNAAVFGGIVAVVALAYVGIGGVPNANVAHAKDKAAKVELNSDESKLGYTVGVQVAKDLKRSQIDNAISIDAVTAGLKDVFAGKELRMTEEDMRGAQVAFQQKMQAEYKAKLDANKAASDKFLAENAKKSGVKKTDSGLQYEVLRKGKGKQPTATDTVKVHYVGTLADGTKFDSSYDRGTPADFPVSGVIPGFSEGLQLMKEGAKYRFAIPSDQAYGEQAPPTIGPNRALVFEVELIEVATQSEPKKAEASE